MFPVLLTLSSLALAADRNVPNDYPNITSALSAATAGVDRVVIAEGLYDERIQLNKSVNIVGAGVGLTVLRPSTGSGPVAQIGAGIKAEIVSLTLDANDARRGLYIDTGADIAMQDVEIANGLAQRGANAQINGASLRLVNAIIRDGNITDGSKWDGAAGIYALDSALTIESSRFERNSAAAGWAWGGAIFSWYGTLTVSDTLFTDNVARTTTSGTGAGIVADSATVAITRSTFRNNDAIYGGALYCTSFASCTVRDSWFEGGVNSTDGGGITIDTADLSLYGSVFCQNGTSTTSTNGRGGAVFLTDATADLRGNVFFQNSAINLGGAVAISGGAYVSIIHNHFVANSARGAGAAISVDSIWTAVDSSSNFVGWSTTQPALQATAGSFAVDYSLFWSNSGGHTSGTTNGLIGANRFDQDPALQNYTAGDCTVQNIYPLDSSPLLNNGDPAYANANGNGNSDIGAFGGRNANPYRDLDGDGSVALYDCDDTNAAVYPGATEVCNGIDDDCDLLIDDADPTLSGAPFWYADSDGDGLGDPNTSQQSCLFPGAGWVDNADDCDDGDPAIGVASNWYTDADADGYGDAAKIAVACVQPSGSVSDSNDCDDSDPTLNPTTVWYTDDDSDGVGDSGKPTQTQCAIPGSGWARLDGDCDDADPAVGRAREFWPDADNDGYGDPAGLLVQDCTVPAGHVANDLDCDDTDPSLNPDTIWYADLDGDGLGDATNPANQCSQPSGYVADDSDCDDTSSLVGAATAWYLDADGDSFGAGTASFACLAPSSYVADDTDCDDLNASINPTTNWYSDLDADGFGDSATVRQACADAGVRVDGDCDDLNATINPDASEVCNGVDDDCDGAIDDDDASLDLSTQTDWYTDLDGDGYGTSIELRACAQPANTANVGGDCNDGDFLISPAAPEQCDLIDHDCDGQVDNDVAQRSWYLDDDNDGYGVSGTTTVACSKPSGYAAFEGDCNDSNSSIHPNANELCDGVDSNCSGDELDASDAQTWWGDGDNDNFGNNVDTLIACDQPAGYAGNNLDCDDTDANISPLGLEFCNGVDDDCNGVPDDFPEDQLNWSPDADGDGWGSGEGSVLSCDQPFTDWVSQDGDCDDSDDSVSPAQDEVCNLRDDDCDGVADDGLVINTWYSDGDGDGFGTDDSAVERCELGDGWVLVGGDCDDSAADVYPGAEDIPDDGIDQDCDGEDASDYELPATSSRANDAVPVTVASLPTGCGCSTGTPRLAGAWLLLALVVVRRRGCR